MATKKKPTKKSGVKTKAKSKQAAKAKTATQDGKLVNFKVSKKELSLIQKKAKTHTEGNVSKWLRLSSVGFTPKGKLKGGAQAHAA